MRAKANIHIPLAFKYIDGFSFCSLDAKAIDKLDEQKTIDFDEKQKRYRRKSTNCA